VAKAVKTGGEVDSWCTKCRMMLNHRIIAMVGSKPVRVECSTCMSHHNFREFAPGDGATTGSATAKGIKGSGPRPARVPTVTRLEQERRDREKIWEKAIAGKAVADFKRYNVSATFSAGDLVRHSKFGDGVVTRVLDANKVEVLFKDEHRTLAQALP
jgi:hypothetical protein